MIREFKIQNDRLTSVKYPKGVTGNVNTYICQFDISCDVPDLLWFCVFIQGKEVYIRDIVDNTCLIPEEVLADAEPIYIGCYGTNCSDNIKRVSTNLVFFDVRQGAYTEGTQPKVPTPEVWETLMARMTPIIGENGNWFTYDITVGDYVDTGKSASVGGGGTGSSDLPRVTVKDDGKVLTVSGGKWVAKDLPQYDGEYSVTPSAEGEITLETAQKLLDADIKVNKIPYSEVSNNSGGNTVFIGSEV